MITEIRHQLKQHPLRFEFFHVTSHQDYHTEKSELSIPERLNICMYGLYDKQYEHPTNNEYHQYQPNLPAQKISFSDPYSRITHNFSDELIKHHRDIRIDQKLEDKWNINACNLQLIDWLSLEKAVTSK